MPKSKAKTGSRKKKAPAKSKSTAKQKPKSLSFHRIAILGATGPTGRALGYELAKHDVRLRVIARHLPALRRAFPEERFDTCEGDALDEASLRAALENCDLVVDCIGLKGPHMAEHPKTAQTLSKIIGENQARCLQVSSYWSYLPVKTLPISEKHPRGGGPDWVKWRRETEDILKEAGAAIVHLPDFFGPHVHTSTLQQPVLEAVAGKTMNWIGPADVERDYIYIPDAMRIVAKLLFHEKAYNDHWIIPGSGPISGNDVADLLDGILGRPVKVRAASPLMLRLVSLFNRELRGFMQMVPEYVKPIRYDGEKIEKLLGRVQHTDYKTALSQTVRAIRET